MLYFGSVFVFLEFYPIGFHEILETDWTTDHVLCVHILFKYESSWGYSVIDIPVTFTLNHGNFQQYLIEHLISRIFFVFIVDLIFLWCFSVVYIFFQKSLTLFCTLSPFCYVSIMTVIGTHSLAMFIVLHCSISLRYFICIKDAYKEHIILGLWRRNIFRNMEYKKLFFFQCTCN